MALKAKWRRDVFNDQDVPTVITDERHTIRTDAEIGYATVQLNEVPQDPGPGLDWLDVRYVSNSVQLVEVQTAPNAGQYQVDRKYPTGLVRFHTTDITKEIKVTYMGLGSVQKVETFTGVQPGWHQWVYTHIPGAITIPTMQKLGWALLDGTTVGSQLSIYFTAVELAFALTETLPDLITGVGGRSLFLRSIATGQSSGIVVDMETPDHHHNYQGNPTGVTVFSDAAEGNPVNVVAHPFAGSDTDTSDIEGLPNVGTETHPAHITAVPFIYCLKGAL